MDIELFRKLGQRLVPFRAAKATFALKADVWFRRGRRVIVAPHFCHLNGRRGTTLPLIPLSEFPKPAYICATAAAARSRNRWRTMSQHEQPAFMIGEMTRFRSMKSSGLSSENDEEHHFGVQKNGSL
jgi:hypothetical protein